MPDDPIPAAPGLEMSQVPIPRQRHEQRLTMRVIVEQIRAEIAMLKTELETVRQMAQAMGERRTADLRAMIHQEVADQMQAFHAEMVTEIATQFGPINTFIVTAEAHRAEDEETRAFVKTEQAERSRRRREELAHQAVWDKKIDQLMVVGVTMLGSLAVTQVPALFTALVGTLSGPQMIVVRAIVVAAILLAIILVVVAQRGKSANIGGSGGGGGGQG